MEGRRAYRAFPCLRASTRRTGGVPPAHPRRAGTGRPRPSAGEQTDELGAPAVLRKADGPPPTGKARRVSGSSGFLVISIDQSLLRRLPVRAPDELVMIYQQASNMGSRMNSYPLFQDLRDVVLVQTGYWGRGWRSSVRTRRIRYRRRQLPDARPVIKTARDRPAARPALSSSRLW